MTLSALSNSANQPVPTTLLELVTALQELTDNEELTELLARDLVNSGRVVLTGNFRGCTLN